MLNSTFKVIYLIGFVVITIVRKYYTSGAKRFGSKIQYKSTIDFVLLFLNGVGMVIPLVYIFSSLLDFANYELPGYVGWLGTFLFVSSILILWRSHKDLNKNWTPALKIKQDHKLVTSGIYKNIRHPMYLAHLVWAIAQILLLHNRIAGYSFIIVFIPFCFIRIQKEEKMMLKHFGDDYKIYMERTKLIIPKLL